MLSRPQDPGRRYDWWRPDAAIKSPHLRFDTHFQADGLPVPAHDRILVAVSGGSDSLALLLLLHEWATASHRPVTIQAATVDHRLRTTSRGEAMKVAQMCGVIGVPHTILDWVHDRHSTGGAMQAREARYSLLMDHARDIGATSIALGHTMDDQAETVLMRAQRGGGTRGYSAMAQWSHHASPDWQVSLYRPLLGVRRDRLKQWLAERNVEWANDPSNEDMGAERVRCRATLAAAPNGKYEALARLAQLCGRHRAWMCGEAARFIRRHASLNSKGQLILPLKLDCDQHALPIVSEALCALTTALGGRDYRLPREKFDGMAQCWLTRKPMRINVGGALLDNSRKGLTIGKEPPRRHSAPTTVRPSTDEPLHPAFERFVPATDLELRRAVLGVLRDTRSA